MTDPLTPRETQILRLMAEDHCPKDIAYMLGIAENTVNQHVSSIRVKLDTQTSCGAVMKAVSLHLIAVSASR